MRIFVNVMMFLGGAIFGLYDYFAVIAQDKAFEGKRLKSLIRVLHEIICLGFCVSILFGYYLCMSSPPKIVDAVFYPVGAALTNIIASHIFENKLSTRNFIMSLPIFFIECFIMYLLLESWS